ncbi:DUF3078 domain-containing protein [Mangrovimonas sp. AS39]|uniref:DUF3078 domain-containing protein n=1 Tax=Mangrovimonas futianensis TaxID=2895523 RepID=UPI001E430F07|nr:DUF3078 domain-containing protein [Mangrovimonas futianensis]MCF1190561.1 DUF3078 domain-containing protein [Mangrovimonas futianensis]MCF1193687.1 DUF3078 domain-containing protein [Mangrovimonas futianensis]MCF1420652.1 DUF3078 domain-containing protein [Mangrovimonas futianensis]
MKKLLLSFSLLCFSIAANAQTLEELKAEKASKQDSIDALQSKVDDLQSQIDKFPGWKFGALGTIGGSWSEFSNWYAQGSPNNASGNINITFNPHAKLDREKYFWYNQANINLGWVKFDDKDDPTDEEGWREAVDVFNVTSLFGYKLSSKLAASTLGEYRTTLLNNFNDPGYLDLGVGVTWTPISNLVVVVHPINYNFVFADNDAIFDSSLGAKIVANYTRTMNKFKFMSNLSAFQSYKSSDLSNWTWINSASYSIWKGIGVGFEIGLRGNKQEAVNYALGNWTEESGEPVPDFDNVDNKIQYYSTFGISYSF